MRVIITGGSGLIGCALLKELVKDGHEVIALSRSPEKIQARLPAGVRAVGWDARSSAGWGDLMDGASAVVNLAGENLKAWRWTSSQKKKIQDSRVNAGKAVVEAVEKANVKPGVLVQASAIGYYGPHFDEILTEDSPVGKDFQCQVLLAFEASTLSVEAMGVRRIIIRSGVVLTLDGGALPLMLLPFKLFVGGKLGSGKQWLSWITMQDEIAAIRYLIESEQSKGIYNLTSPNPIRNADFSRVVGRVLKRPSVFPAPAFILKLVLGEMSTIVLDGQRVIPERLDKIGFRFKYPDVEGALKALLK